MSGEIIEVGEQVTNVKVGQKVATVNNWGSHAALRSVPARNCWPIPDGFDVRKQVLGLVAEHLRPMAFYKTRDTVTDGAFRRLAQKVDLELLVRFARADCTGRAGTSMNTKRWLASVTSSTVSVPRSVDSPSRRSVTSNVLNVPATKLRLANYRARSERTRISRLRWKSTSVRS